MPVPSDLSPRASHAMTQIKQRIADGTWPVGTKIPTETQLCDLFQVGRNTIREAVHSLVHSGVLYKRQGSGTFVMARDELTGVITRRISQSGFRDSLEARRGIEIEAARLAAERHTEADAAELTTLLSKLNRALEEPLGANDPVSEDLVDVDLQLHRAIVAASKNTLLLSLYDSILGAITSSIRTNLDASLHAPSADTDLRDYHGDVVKAILARDPDGTTDALVRTFQHFLDMATHYRIGVR